MKFIFLDIDGCLNDHSLMENGYCGIDKNCVTLLNQLLKDHRDVWIVSSSAWRYLVLGKDMTVKGFEELLLSHGVCCYGRVHGITLPDELYWPFNPTDEDYADLTVRARQIQDYVKVHEPEAYVVIDDLDLPVENFVRADGKIGITQENIDAARILLDLH